MAFRKTKVEFLQKERDELPHRRPVIIHLVCPVHSRDYQQHTPQYQLFRKAEGGPTDLPAGVSKKEGNPYNHCLIEAHPALAQLEEQLVAVLEEYREAAYKVVVLNGHGCADGVVLQETEEGKSTVLTGRAVAEMTSRHHHSSCLHLFNVAAYGHRFADDFMQYIQTTYSDEKKVRSLFAVTFFTSESSPEAWQRPATAGDAHVELKRDVSGFLTKHVQPNSPYKVLDSHIMAKSACVLL